MDFQARVKGGGVRKRTAKDDQRAVQITVQWDSQAPDIGLRDRLGVTLAWRFLTLIRQYYLFNYNHVDKW
ncbi:hypothetical protein M407DRAFT_151561 [Tulasnella calospora MUT 4182]|uniref:Uncharacterized protein n=1 Tax=Tulasnella calospora MUT 4182 TaxID=1051891 RepID=A0A0C3QY98_9AGAM|nr:hypothetical protein M407DRAFT_151561 [Tulasnella calospora MUT 4182]